MDDSHYETLLAKQLVMNQQTWVALQKHSVTEDTELRLDFSYNAPNRESAEILRAFLVQETDYEVRVESEGSFLRKNWRLEGSTQPTSISPQILDQWVTWMVIAGKDKGGCDFDGWGTSV
jgi:hypothetical protein